MKVVYLLASSEISGGARVAMQQAEELARRGHDVAVVSPDPPPDWFILRAARWEQSPWSASRALAAAEVRIATFWTTVEPALAGASGPVFHLCQGFEADFSFYAERRAEILEAYRRPTRKLAIAPHLVDRLAREGIEAALIGQTFDPADFPPAADRRFDRARPVVLLAGIYEADVKGVAEALAGLSQLRRAGVLFLLRRVSPMRPSEQESALGVVDEYCVRLTPEQMSRAYRSSDLLIGPSHAEEGFGLPALEALSSGLPALLSNTPAHRHIAGDAAAYFEAGDAAALAREAGALLSDPGRRRELSRLGPEAARRFSTSDVADRLLAELGCAGERATRA
jgi:glycosyltransferase involved in cell wall biosynthesis